MNRVGVCIPAGSSAHTYSNIVRSFPEIALTLEAPDILVQAGVCGRALRHRGREVGTDIPHDQMVFYRLLRQLLVMWWDPATPETRTLIPLPSIHCSDGSLECLDTAASRFQITLYTAVGTEQTTAQIERPEGGYWLEELMAVACHDAGADEVRCGLRWGWQDAHNPRSRAAGEGEDTKDEVDVVARFGTRFVAIECKAGCHLTRKRQALRDIEEKARFDLGHFCLPILLRPAASQQDEAERFGRQRGAAVLDLASIADSTALRQLFDRLFALRGTVSCPRSINFARLRR